MSDGDTSVFEPNMRILLIDDNEQIHADFRKILDTGRSGNADRIDLLERALFETVDTSGNAKPFEIDSALQGQDGLRQVRDSIEAGRPYAVAFVDMRMPPGWDGVETIERLWQSDAELQIVICTAYSDYTFEEMTARLGNPERWLVLKKPFDHVEVRQLAQGLAEKWTLARQARMHVNQLEALVEQRTREITDAREQLLQSQKLEALGTLAGGVAHEFNNLVQIISGYAGIAKDDLPEDSGIHGELDQILIASDRAADLTGRLLGFSRRQPLERTRFSVDRLLADLAALLQPLLDEHMEFQLDVCPDVGAVDGDAGQLHQALLNLCLNARDAMPDGGRLTVRARRSDGHVVLSVSDNGTGISPDIRQKIFDPFFTTKDVGKGTGLGLSFVLGVVEEHGGTVQCNSTPGDGTTFRVSLPPDATCQPASALGANTDGPSPTNSHLCPSSASRKPETVS